MPFGWLIGVAVAACGGGDSGSTGSTGSPTQPQPVVASVVVTPSTASLLVGDTTRLSASPRESFGNPVSGKVATWSASPATVATVTSSGLVTAVGAGTATVTAAVDGKTGTASITVAQRTPVASITLDYSAPTLARGQELELKPTLRDSSGSIVPGRALAWTSSDPTVIKVEASGATGKLTAGIGGTATVTASIDGATARATPTVIAFNSIVAGVFVSCAITTDGRLFCAGGSYGSAAVPVAPTLRFLSVSVDGAEGSNAQQCAIATDHAAYCWGDNDLGQLGTGDVAKRAEPTRVSTDQQFVSVSVGQFHTCGITVDGDPYCWGGGSEGRLGLGDETGHLVPVRVPFPGGIRFKQIEAGANATCAVALSGQAYCWGRNDLGQLGSSSAAGGDLGDRSLVPVPVDAASSTKQVVTKGPRSCILTTEGRALCFGNNTVGELGVSQAQICYGQKPCSRTPVAVETNATFVSLSTSTFATCGLTAEKSMLCWGMDYEYLFGPTTITSCGVSGTMYPCTKTPVPGPAGFVANSLNRGSQCGIKESGVAYCWGSNDYGQRGSPTDGAPDPSPKVFSIAPRSTP